MNPDASSPRNLIDVLDQALARYGLKAQSSGQFIRLPAIWSGRRDYCVSVAPNGAWTDFSSGEKGRLADLLQHLGIDAAAGNVSLNPVNRHDIEKKQLASMRFARKTWDRGVPVCASPEGKIVRRYLAHRGLPPGLIRHISHLARVQTEPDGIVTLMLPMFAPCAPYALIGMQRVFLDPSGRKAGSQPKQMLGVHKYRENAFAGCLIAADRSRSAPGDVTLALCEGFETGLAIHAASGYAVYVLYDRGGLMGAHIEYLRQLAPARLIIGADNDDPDDKGRFPGQEAALFLGSRLQRDKIDYQIALPPRGLGGNKGADWLDVWNADPDNMLWLLNRPKILQRAGPGHLTVKSGLPKR